MPGWSVRQQHRSQVEHRHGLGSRGIWLLAAVDTSVRSAARIRRRAGGPSPSPPYNATSGATARGLAGAYCQLAAADVFVASRAEACGGRKTLGVALLCVALGVVCALHPHVARRCARRLTALRFRVAHRRARSKLKIAIGFYQIVTQLGDVYEVAYPPSYQRVLDVFRVANLALFGWLPGLHPTCLGLPTLLSQLLAAILVPLGVTAGAMGLGALRGKAAHTLAWITSPSSSPVGVVVGFRALARVLPTGSGRPAFSPITPFDGGGACVEAAAWAVSPSWRSGALCVAA